MATLPVGGTKALPAGAQVGTLLVALIDVKELGGIGATTKVKAINIPPGTFVHKFSAKVIEPETGSGTRTFSLGDEGGGAAFLAATSAKTAAMSVGAVVAGGKSYTAADCLNLTTVEALTDAVIEVRALCFQL